MNRRTVLTAAGIALVTPLSGCPSTGAGGDDDRTGAGTPIEEEAAYEIGFAEQEGNTSNAARERILITNVSGERRSVSGYTLTYSSGYEYTFTGGLTLESGGTVADVTQGAGDGVAESDPPTYYRDADLPELVLDDGEETVRLLDADDEVVREATYTRGE